LYPIVYPPAARRHRHRARAARPCVTHLPLALCCSHPPLHPV